MSAENKALPTGTIENDSNDSSVSDSPLVDLITMQGLKPMHEMSDQELTEFVQRLRQNRQSHQTFLATIRAESETNRQPKAVTPKKAKKEPTDDMLAGYV